MVSENEINGYALTKVIKFQDNPLIVDHERLFIDDLCIDPLWNVSSKTFSININTCHYEQ